MGKRRVIPKQSFQNVRKGQEISCFPEPGKHSGAARDDDQFLPLKLTIFPCGIILADDKSAVADADVYVLWRKFKFRNWRYSGRVGKYWRRLLGCTLHTLHFLFFKKNHIARVSDFRRIFCAFLMSCSSFQIDEGREEYYCAPFDSNVGGN